MNNKTKKRIGTRGQVVIPKRLRERFGLLPNTEAEFIEDKGELIVRPVREDIPTHQDAWDKVWGILHGKIDDIDHDIEEMRGR
jgi:AbrB family looped-hinge helix DNA binding protein